MSIGTYLSRSGVDDLLQKGVVRGMYLCTYLR